MALDKSYLCSLSPLDQILSSSIESQKSLRVASCPSCKTLFIKNIHNQKYCNRKCFEIDYSINNKNRLTKNMVNYRKRNPNYDKDYLRNNPNKRKQTQKKYRENNKESILLYDKQYKKNNPHIRRKIYNKHHMNKRKNNLDYKLKCDYRSRVSGDLKAFRKCTSSMKLLGCTIEELWSHLESLFTEGMTRGNRGVHGWHVDHIVPVSSFDFTKDEDQRKCCHFSNLQPLWALDNLKKSDKF